MRLRHRWLLLAGLLALSSCDINPQPEVPSDDETNTDYGDDGGVTATPGYGGAGGGDQWGDKQAQADDREAKDPNAYGGFDNTNAPPSGSGEEPRPLPDARDAGASVPEAGGVITL